MVKFVPTPDSIKLQIVETYLYSDLTAKEVAARYNLAEGTVRRFVKEFKEGRLI